MNDNFTALVIGARGGIGSAMVSALEKDPRCERVIGASRTGDYQADIGDKESLKALAKRLRDEGVSLDFLFIATGILAPEGKGPEKSLSALDPETMKEVFQINAFGPALAIAAFAPLLRRNAPTRVAALSARVGSIGDNGLGGWYSYRASKAALNQLLHSAAIELQRKHTENVCVALHPGTIETALTAGHANGNFTHSPEECVQNLLTVLDSLTPADTGEFFDYAGKAIPW